MRYCNICGKEIADGEVYNSQSRVYPCLCRDCYTKLYNDINKTKKRKDERKTIFRFGR